MNDNFSDEDSNDILFEKNEDKNFVEINDPTLVKWKEFCDYRFVEYYLKTSLGIKCPVSILAIHNVKNEEAFSKTEDIVKNNQWTYGWYKLKKEHLNPSNDSDRNGKDRNNQDIIGILKTKGFIEKDREFTVGNISSFIKESENCLLLLCKLFIGNALCIKEEKKAKEANSIDKKIPPYYNSYKILTSDNMVLQLEEKMNDIKDKSFKYDLLKPNYICPLYVVEVKAVLEADQRKNDKYFCRCEQKEAEFFCLQCEDYFDKECYDTKHKQKNNEYKHENKTQKIQHKQKEGICAEHKDREAAYYCVVCNKQICSICKIKVNKNDKESVHFLHPVKDIYQAFKEEVQNNFLSNEIRKRAVKQLKKIKKTVKALIEKQIMIEKEIEHEFRDENDMIQSLTKEAKLKHFSVSAELNEMKKHLSNMDAYYLKRFKAMKEAKLKPEALWIKDNYDEVMNNIYKNFSEINLDYKVDKDSFKKIKQTELKIIKKIDLKKPPSGGVDKEEVYLNDIIKRDDQYILTKKIVSLKYEKEEAKKKLNKEAENKSKAVFNPFDEDFGYALFETSLNKNEKARKDYELHERKAKKEEEEKK